jgi:hypothetical protein
MDPVCGIALAKMLKTNRSIKTLDLESVYCAANLNNFMLSRIAEPIHPSIPHSMAMQER